jgi:tRNA A37 threonylcarbamoyladenosine modification protein TsaB
MELEINLEKNKTILCLSKDKKIIDQIEWEEKNNLSRTLLKMIDEMLKKHKLDQKEVSLSVKSAFPSGFTSNRIAQSIAKAFNWGNRQIK